MDKQILFKLYGKLYSENISEIDCEDCIQCEEYEESVVLFPFEEEFISNKLGKKQKTWSVLCKVGKLKTLNKPTVHCKFFKNNRCIRYNVRPVSCRIYPFNPNIQGNKLNLYLDLSCPIAKKLLNNKEFTNKMIKICKELAEKVDSNFWKSWSTMPVKLDDPKRNEKFVCFLRNL